MNKKHLAWILAAMIATPSAAFAGSIRREPANLGTARVGGQAGLFTYSFDNGAVFANEDADWALGLVIDSVPPTMKVTVPAMAATSAGAAVRIVTSLSSGNQVSATAFQALPVAATYQRLDFFPIANGDFVFVDAIMKKDASILGAEFNQ